MTSLKAMWDVDAAGGADPAADPAGAPPPETDGVEKERRNSVTSLKAMWNVGDGGAEGETAGDPGPCVDSQEPLGDGRARRDSVEAIQDMWKTKQGSPIQPSARGVEP